MPETDYRYLLAEDAELVVELITEKGKVGRYSVVLLARVEGEWRTVRVYDNHLGAPHMHRYTRAGIKQDGEKTGEATASDGYNIALEQVRTGFQEMIDGWHRS
jgi:hypothetical protein